jgi:hypothetical protein
MADVNTSVDHPGYDHLQSATKEATKETVKAAEKIMLEGVDRLSLVTENALKICQNQIALQTSVMQAWGDAWQTLGSSMNQVIERTHKIRDEVRRTGIGSN